MVTTSCIDHQDLAYALHQAAMAPFFHSCDQPTNMAAVGALCRRRCILVYKINVSCLFICRAAVKCFMVASDGGLSEGYGHDGPVVCLGDGQTEAYLKDMGMTGLASA